VFADEEEDEAGLIPGRVGRARRRTGPSDERQLEDETVSDDIRR
jgi:hypothetical protein